MCKTSNAFDHQKKISSKKLFQYGPNQKIKLLRMFKLIHYVHSQEVGMDIAHILTYQDIILHKLHNVPFS